MITYSFGKINETSYQKSSSTRIRDSNFEFLTIVDVTTLNFSKIRCGLFVCLERGGLYLYEVHHHFVAGSCLPPKVTSLWKYRFAPRETLGGVWMRQLPSNKFILRAVIVTVIAEEPQRMLQEATQVLWRGLWFCCAALNRFENTATKNDRF